MAQLLDHTNFRFNGVSSEMYQLQIISTGSINDERIFGLNSSIEYEDGIGDNKLFIRRKNDTYSFEVELTKLNGWGNPLPISEKEYDKIIMWLCSSSPKPLEVGGIVHYGTFNNGREYHNSHRLGVIKLTFESASPYAYSPIITSQVKVIGSKIIKLENKSNVNNHKVYIDIDIEKINTAGSINIINKRIGKSFKINNLALNEIIRITGDGVFDVESLTNPDKNLFNSLEYDSFPYLVYGVNSIEIVGDCRAVIKYQVPIALR